VSRILRRSVARLKELVQEGDGSVTELRAGGLI
jgi:hypothetical protein